MTRHRLTSLTLTVLCLGALGACKSKDNLASTDTMAARTDSAAGRIDSTAMARVDSTKPMATTSGSWNNDRIFGFAHNANAGEIALGKLAEKKATSSQVKAFAREMVKDHQAMMTEAHSLFGKLKATVDTTADDAHDLAKNGVDKLKELTDKAAGKDWDKNYIDDQVETHQKVLDKLQDAAKNTTDSTVTNALSKTTAKVQEHLTKAQTLKAQLDK
jgi:putative membrane protein